MNSLPFWDLYGRTMSLGRCDVTIEALLRLQNSRQGERPITFYILGSPHSEGLTIEETMAICDVLRELRSPVQTVGMGLLTTTQSIVLAAGTSRRLLLSHTVISLGEIRFSASTATRRVGINNSRRTNPPEEVQEQQFPHLLTGLGISIPLTGLPRLLGAVEAIEHGFADQILQELTEKRKRGRANERAF